MMNVLIWSLGILTVSFNGIAKAEDLSKIDRTLDKQPAYASKEPKYCLLVFGPKADTRVWLVLDLAYDPLREKPGKTESLYADLNGNGNLTDAGQQIPVTVVTQKQPETFIGSQRFPAYEQHLPRFEVGDVKSRDGKTVYKNLVVDVGWYFPGRKDRVVTVSVEVPAYGRQSVGGQLLWFADTPAGAPVVWFDGALTMRLAPSGMLHIPIDYTGKEPPPPTYEEFPLVRGKTMPIRVEIGTAGVGPGTFNAISADKTPKDAHPIAKVLFAPSDPKHSPIEISTNLDKRCCGTLFCGSIRVPTNAALGKAKITLSYPDWKDGYVSAASAEVTVSDEDTRPRVFREQ
jgi:hypothetical protein